MIGEEKSYLALCQALKEELPALPLTSGSIIARGYADVGFEEYLVLTNGSLVSVLSGKPVEVTSEDLEKHYFRVPDGDELSHVLSLFDLIIETVEYQEQRWWVVEARHEKTGARFAARSHRLSHAFLSVFVESQGKTVKQQAPLRVVSGAEERSL